MANGLAVRLFRFPPVQQIGGQFERALVAVSNRFRETFEADSFEFGGAVRRQAAGPLRLHVLDGAKQAFPRWVGERLRSGEQLIEDDTQRPDVRGRLDTMRFTANLFRGHVRDRASHPVFVPRAFADMQSQPEVEQMREAAGIQQDVLRFHIAMDHALQVSRMQDGRDLGDQSRNRVRIDRFDAVPHPTPQAFAIKVLLHHTDRRPSQDSAFQQIVDRKDSAPR